MKEYLTHLDDKLYYRLKNGNHSINLILALGFQKIDESRTTIEAVDKDKLKEAK